MATQTYLLFKLNDLAYGIQSTYVREIFQLPELTPIADAPGDIIGILNFRGAILPVMHLAKRLGQPMPPCQIQDRVIVVEWEGMQVGVVVHQVDDVQLFSPAMIEPEPAYGHVSPMYTAFVAGIVKNDDRLITVLNLETLIRQTDGVTHMIWGERLNQMDDGPLSVVSEGQENGRGDRPQYSDSESTSEPYTPAVLTNFFDCYCPNSTAEERQIFHQRAQELSQTQTTSSTERFLPLAVMKLGDEYFGLDLDAVQEFITIRQVTPIPCCPPHILGDINLRGEVVTILDIRNALNLTSDPPQPNQTPTFNCKAMIVQIEEIIAGIIVDQVLDVIYVPPADVSALPTSLSRQAQRFFKGIVAYEPKPLTILSLQTLFSQGDLVVDQVA